MKHLELIELRHDLHSVQRLIGLNDRPETRVEVLSAWTHSRLRRDHRDLDQRLGRRRGLLRRRLLGGRFFGRRLLRRGLGRHTLGRAVFGPVDDHRDLSLGQVAVGPGGHRRQTAVWDDPLGHQHVHRPLRVRDSHREHILIAGQRHRRPVERLCPMAQVTFRSNHRLHVLPPGRDLDAGRRAHGRLGGGLRHHGIGRLRRLRGLGDFSRHIQLAAHLVVWNAGRPQGQNPSKQAASDLPAPHSALPDRAVVASKQQSETSMSHSASKSLRF